MLQENLAGTGKYLIIIETSLAALPVKIALVD